MHCAPIRTTPKSGPFSSLKTRRSSPKRAKAPHISPSHQMFEVHQFLAELEDRSSSDFTSHNKFQGDAHLAGALVQPKDVVRPTFPRCTIWPKHATTPLTTITMKHRKTQSGQCGMMLASRRQLRLLYPPLRASATKRAGQTLHGLFLRPCHRWRAVRFCAGRSPVGRGSVASTREVERLVGASQHHPLLFVLEPRLLQGQVPEMGFRILILSPLAPRISICFKRTGKTTAS